MADISRSFVHYQAENRYDLNKFMLAIAVRFSMFSDLRACISASVDGVSVTN